MNITRYISGIKAASKIMTIFLTGKRMPVYTGLFITERCNLKCIYCFTNAPNRRVKDPPKEILFRIIDELYKLGTRYITVLGGEPLIRKDFGEIVDYIKSKKILVGCVTNGYFTKHKINDLKKLTLVCFSLDGNEKYHDINRGEGSYKKVMESLDLCKKNNINIQINAVINKHNVDYFKDLLKFTHSSNIPLFFAEQANVEDEHKPYSVDSVKIRDFWIKVKEYKKQGYKINKSFVLLDKIINYPTNISYNKIFKKNEVMPFLSKCNLKRGYCLIDANGVMHPCVNLFGKYGKNVFEVKVEEAWDYLKYVDCFSCRQCMQEMKNDLFSPDLRTFFAALRLAALNFFQK